MIFISETLKVLSGLSELQKTQAKEVGGDKTPSTNQAIVPLAPTFSNIAEVTNRLTYVLKEIALVPLTLGEITLTPLKLVQRALNRLKQRAVSLTEKQSAQFLETAGKIPVAADSELHALWENLLVYSISEDYHPTYADILAALRAPDAKLLNSLVRMMILGKPIVPSNFTSRNLPACFFLKKKLQKEKLALSLTILERESLIATSNNLGNYFSSEMLDLPAKLDPKAHQVTHLGFALHRACSNPATKAGAHKPFAK